MMPLLPRRSIVVGRENRHVTVEEDVQIRTLHHEWKQKQGYSLTEIERKSRSIANVMPVDTLTVHKKRLEAVGFTNNCSMGSALYFARSIGVSKLG